MKVCYPRISGWIEKIPLMAGKIMTWVMVLLFSCDMVISGLAILRYVDRTQSTGTDNVVESFLDYNYPDEIVEFIYPCMKIRRS